MSSTILGKNTTLSNVGFLYKGWDTYKPRIKPIWLLVPLSGCNWKNVKDLAFCAKLEVSKIDPFLRPVTIGENKTYIFAYATVYIYMYRL